MAFIHSPKVVTDGLIWYIDAANTKSYPGSGTNWNEITGNGASGSLVNGPVFSSAAAGSIDLDGTNDYVTGSITQLPTGNTAHSIDAWFILDSYGSARTWILTLGQRGAGAIHWLVTSETNTQFGIFGSTQLAPTIQLNTWTNIVLTYSGTTLTAYKNGLFSSSIAASTVNFTSKIFSIAFNGASEAFMNGRMASVRIYNRALSTTEVLQNYNATRGRFGV